MISDFKNILLKHTQVGYPSNGKKELAQLEQYSFGSHFCDVLPLNSIVVKVITLVVTSCHRRFQCSMKVHQFVRKISIVPTSASICTYDSFSIKVCKMGPLEVPVTRLFTREKSKVPETKVAQNCPKYKIRMFSRKIRFYPVFSWFWVFFSQNNT